MTVSGKRRVVTGIRIPGSGGYGYHGYEYDPPYLSSEKHHVILKVWYHLSEEFEIEESNVIPIVESETNRVCPGFKLMTTDKYTFNLNTYILHWFDGYASVLRNDIPSAPDHVVHWFCEGCLYGFETETSDFLLPRKRIDLSSPPEQTSGPLP